MDWSTLLRVLCTLLGMLIISPLVIALFLGRESACAEASHIKCFREWITALSGPIAILAAIVAAWPVWEQLEEARVTTRLATATAIGIQEANVQGIMSALSNEEKEVELSIGVINNIKKDVENLISDRKSSEKNDLTLNIDDFISFKKQVNEYIESSITLSEDMSSKLDKDTVIKSRNDIAFQFKNLAEQLRKIQSYGSMADAKGSLVTEFKQILSTCDLALAADHTHQVQFDEVTNILVRRLNGLVEKRKSYSNLE